jgi:hypothetical protein
MGMFASAVVMMPEEPSAPCEGRRDDILEEPRLSDGLRLPVLVMLCGLEQQMFASCIRGKDAQCTQRQDSMTILTCENCRYSFAAMHFL